MSYYFLLKTAVSGGRQASLYFTTFAVIYLLFFYGTLYFV